MNEKHKIERDKYYTVLKHWVAAYDDATYKQGEKREQHSKSRHNRVECSDAVFA